MSALPQSKRFRRVFIGCLSFGLAVAGLYGAVCWHGYRRHQEMKEFWLTTNVDKNPWGLERGMSEGEVRSRLSGSTAGYYDVLSSAIYQEYKVEHDGVLYKVAISIERIEGQNAVGLTSIKLLSGQILEPGWLKWLRTNWPL